MLHSLLTRQNANGVAAGLSTTTGKIGFCCGLALQEFGAAIAMQAVKLIVAAGRTVPGAEISRNFLGACRKFREISGAGRDTGAARQLPGD